MENFLLYLYYRSQNIRNKFLQLREETPLAFFPAINCASLLILIMKLLTRSGIINISSITITFCIVITGAFLVLFIILVPIYLFVSRKKVRRTINNFEQETTAERKMNGRKIIRYIFTSFIAILVAFLL
jgi:uncharacterized membrane protein